MSKLPYVSPTERMYDELPPEGQEEVRKNIHDLAKYWNMEEGFGNWEWLIKEIYDKYNQQPDGWFKWWEED